MRIKPIMRNYVCFTAHPVGCEKNIAEQINYVKKQKPLLDIESAVKNVLIIGASTGYGMASRICATYELKANTVGVFFERPAEKDRTASAGFYNTAAFEKIAKETGKQHYSINADAFLNETKEKVIHLIKEKLGKIDLVVYSIASPKRTNPQTGEIVASFLRSIGENFTTKTLNVSSGKITEISLSPATQEEIDKTVYVMGGEDWKLWIHALFEADVLAEGVKTVAYSYIGPQLTAPIYRNGTIGRAKEDLEKTAFALKEKLKAIDGTAFVSVNKALVTQASSAIPAVPLYISLLYKIMKEKNIHEECIQQIYRLFKEFLYNPQGVKVDEEGRIRIDDLEMLPEIQEKIERLWDKITEENINEYCDTEGYKKDFFRLFGFEVEGVDYEKEVDPNLQIPSC